MVMFGPLSERLLHVATLYITRSRSKATPVERVVKIGIEWRRTKFERGDWVRERLAFVIMVAILIFLFAFTFAVLGKGEYEPSEGSAPFQASSVRA